MTPSPSSPAPADDPLTAALEEIRERARHADQVLVLGGNFGEAAARSQADVPRLRRCVEAVLKLAGEWEQTAARLEPRAEFMFDRGDRSAANVADGRAFAYRDCARALREDITRELTGKEDAQ